MPMIKGKAVEAIVFDAYGTLFDVHAAVMHHATELGALAQPVSDLWRAKQLEYTWIRTLSGRYAPFWQLTEEALDYALRTLAPVHLGLRGRVLEAYRDLDAYPDVDKSLADLRATGLKIAILSNGDSTMLERAVAASGLGDAFDALISVDEIKAYKTTPDAYRLVEQHLGIKPEATAFVSSNRWDIAGASIAGFHSLWLNRAGRVDEYADMAPAAVIVQLGDIVRN